MSKLTLLSQRQIQSNIINQLVSLLGINDINKGSVLDVLTAAIAREDFAQYIQMAKITRLVDLEALSGTDLDNKAFEYGITRRAALAATGTIDIIRAAGFVKVSSTFYAGTQAPIVGNTTINVNDASNALYSTSGTLILGRDTDNAEEVTYSSAPVNNTNYWTFTISALTKNHAVEETVILKQGTEETILAGTNVIVPANSISKEIKYSIVSDQILKSGEERLQDVDIVATNPGAIGNISSYAITGTAAFPSAPFAGARAENTSKFTTGTDIETDAALRDRIKSHIQSLSKGTKLAILNAIVGLVDPVSAKRVVSSNVILPQNTETPVKVYIDDGTGFEPSFSAKGFETIVAKSTGGETRLQLDTDPLVKAQIETNAAEQYNFSSGIKTLTFTVGNNTETINFDLGDFAFPETGTAEEVVTAINNKATIIEARTSQSGTKVVIAAKVDVNEDIQVIGGTANSILAFPTDKKSTLYLYIDDILKSKDGNTAAIISQNQAPFNLVLIGAFPQYLTLIVDGKSANAQTITFQSADFTDPTAATVSEIIAVINAQLAGASAFSFNNNTQVQIVSNKTGSVDSKIQIVGGTINSPTNGLNFSTVEVAGSAQDYVLNRELGTIELTSPLVANQSVTAGSRYTKAYLRASSSENYSPSNGQTLVISVEGGANQTITFDATFAAGKSAAVTAAFINAQLEGATAYARTIGTNTYLEISTNTFEQSVGSIRINSTSTANSTFNFALDTTVYNQRPHVAYQESTIAGPYDFTEGDSLVVVINNDIVNNTFSVPLSYSGTLTGVTDASNFALTAFSNVFTSDSILNDFRVCFTSGANTSTATVTTVALVSGSTYRYTFAAPLANFANFFINDAIKITGMAANTNNGNFVITNIDASGNFVDVVNADAVPATSATGTGVVGSCRVVNNYQYITGALAISSALPVVPSIGDTIVVMPTTVSNLVGYINNTRVSSISLKANVLGSSNNTKLQISSKSNGSDGYIQITGGSANLKLGFTTNLARGLQAYNYYTGLLALVHKTIYGDDTDLVSYPGVGAAGIKFQVLAPTTTQQSVELTVALDENTSIAQVENSILSAITGYINNLGVGEDIIIEEIRAAVIKISGIIDVTVYSPTENIAIADNELGRIRSSNISIG